jgi:hypothetical protein
MGGEDFTIAFPDNHSGLTAVEADAQLQSV